MFNGLVSINNQESSYFQESKESIVLEEFLLSPTQYCIELIFEVHESSIKESKFFLKGFALQIDIYQFFSFLSNNRGKNANDFEPKGKMD